MIPDHGLYPHVYAGDTQIYGFCRVSASLLAAEHHYTSCVGDVARWMRSNKLQLAITAKTEALWSIIGLYRTPISSAAIQSPLVTDEVTPTDLVPELCIYITSTLTSPQ